MIPLSAPYLAGREWAYVKDCLDTGWISSAGAYVTRFEQAVASFARVKYGVGCINGTAGLHLALRTLGVNRGDLVIIPNLTFVATANAVAYLGADPVLIDVDRNTWQMDLDLLRRFLSDDCVAGPEGVLYRKRDQRRVAAIMPVHVLGNMGDVERLNRIAAEFRLVMVEDSTEALGSTYAGSPAGGFGKVGVFSFNGNKILSTGGGGVVVTPDPVLAKAVKHLSTQAKSAEDVYFHDEIGYNYRLVNVLAAIGVGQMELLPEILGRKRAIDARYRAELSGVGDVGFQAVLPKCEPNCWLFTITTSRARDLREHLGSRGVESRPLWVPLDRLPMYASTLYVTTSDRAGEVYDRCLSLPSGAGLNDDQLARVIAEVKSFFKLVSP